LTFKLVAGAATIAGVTTFVVKLRLFPLFFSRLNSFSV